MLYEGLKATELCESETVRLTNFSSTASNIVRGWQTSEICKKYEGKKNVNCKTVMITKFIEW